MPSATKRIAKNFSWLMAGNAISGGLNFLAIVYIARVLGASAFGLFQFAQAFLLYLVIIVDSGLSVYGTREIAKEKERAGAIGLNVLALRLVLALVLCFFSIILVMLLPLPLNFRLLFVLTFLFVFYRALNVDWIFQGIEKMEYIALSKVLFSGLQFLAVIWLINDAGDLLKIPALQFVLGLIVSLTLVLFLFFKIIPFDLHNLQPRSWRPSLMAAVPLGASIIMMLIYDNMDTIMLGIMTRPAVVGYYNAAYRIFYVFAGVVSVWVTVLFPVLSYRLASDLAKARELMQKSLRLTMLFAVPAAALVFLTAPLIVQVVFGGQYGGSVGALRVLIWALIPLAIANTYGGLLLVAAGHFRQFFLAVMVGALANVLLNLALIPAYSLLGAAAATIAAQALTGVLAFYFSRKIVRLGLINSLAKPVFIAGLAAAAYLATASAPVYLIVSALLIVLLEGKFLLVFTKEVLHGS